MSCLERPSSRDFGLAVGLLAVVGVGAQRGSRVGCTAGWLLASVGWPVGLVGAVPAEFEAADEAVFDFGCDVAVGLDEPVTEMVTEASGLADFGDVAGDEPGLVAVPESVEGQAGSNCRGAFPVVAVTAGRNTRRSKSLRRSGCPS